MSAEPIGPEPLERVEVVAALAEVLEQLGDLERPDFHVLEVTRGGRTWRVEVRDKARRGKRR